MMDCAWVGRKWSTGKEEKRKGGLNGGGRLTPVPKLTFMQNGRSRHLGKLPGWKHFELAVSCVPFCWVS